MNKEYINIDGKTLISDENGKIKLEEYYDGLNEVLVQENLVEEMEKQITKLTEENKNVKKHYIPVVLPTVALASTLGANIIFYVCTGVNPLTTQVNTIFGTLNYATFWSLGFSTVTLPIGAIFEGFLYKIYKYNKKDKNGKDKELEYLEKQIIREKEILEELKKDKSNKLEEVKVNKVDYKKQLEELKNELNYYYSLGYSEEENKLIKRK